MDRRTWGIVAVMVAGALAALVPTEAVAASASGGDLLWLESDPRPGNQVAAKAVVGPDGAVIVAGTWETGAGLDCRVVKLGPSGGGVEWAETHDQAGGDDRVAAVAVDSVGNVVVAAYVFNGVNFDLLTMAYDHVDGHVLWMQSFDGPAHGDDYATGLALDAADNVYVAGYSQGANAKDDFAVVRYTSAGATSWSRVWDGGAAGHARIRGVAAAGTGVVVTGEAQVEGLDYDCVTTRLDSSSATVWQARRTHSGDDGCRLVRVDPSGDVLVAGQAAHGGHLDLFVTKKRSATGTTAWEFLRDGGYTEEPAALAIDAAGEVFVAGNLFQLASATDIFTARIAGATGALVWSDTYNSVDGTEDTSVDLALGANGDVFVAADRYDPLVGRYDVQVLKFAGSTGARVWAKPFDGPVSRDDRVAGVGLGVDGRVVVGGYSNAQASGATDFDFVAFALTPGDLNRPTQLQATVASATQVTLHWVDNATDETGFEIERRLSPSGTWVLIGTADADAEVYSDTTAGADTAYDYRVRAVRGAGTWSDFSDTTFVSTTEATFAAPDWVFVLAGDGGGDDQLVGIATGPDADPVTTGSSFSIDGQFDYVTLKLDGATGTVRWQERYDGDQNDVDLVQALAVDANNDVVVTGTSVRYAFPANTNDIYTLKYPAAGGPAAWEAQYNGPAQDDDRAVSVAAVPGATGYNVVGYGKNADWNDDIYALRYDPLGNLLWAAAPYDGGVLGDDVASGVAENAAGDAFVSGWTQNGTSYDMWVARYVGATGQRAWVTTFNGAGNGDDFATAIVTENSAVYVTGRSRNAAGNFDLVTLGLTAETGEVRWVRTLDGDGGGDDEGVFVGVDPMTRDVVVAGTTLAGPANDEIVVVRYDEDGNQVWLKTVVRPAHLDRAEAAAMDLSGNVYVAGKTDGGTGWDALVVVLDEHGTQVTGTTYDASSGRDDGLRSIAVNRRGEAFAAGHRTTADGDFDFLAVRVSNPLLLAPGPLAVTPTYTSVTLQWYANSPNVDGYRVDRRTGACATSVPWQTLTTTTAGVTSYADSGLTGGATFCYRVKAFRTASGTWSRPAQLEVQVPVPPPPGAVVATATNTSSVTLTWADNTTGEDGFVVQRCAGSGCTNFADLATPAANATSTIDTGVCNGTTYSYRVKARLTGQWESAWSSSATVTTPAAPPPTNVTATRASESQVNLAWTDNATDETGYRVLRCTGAGCTNFATVATLAANAVSWSNSGLQVDTTYRYQIAPYKTASCAWQVSSATVEVVTTLLAPSAVTATVIDTTSIALAWTDNTAGETGFTVQRCTGSGCTSFATLTTTAANATTFRDDAACASNTYRYQVLAVRSGSWTSTPSAATPDVTTGSPVAPGALAAVALSEGRVALTWIDNTTDETGFRIERCQGAGCINFAAVSTVASGTTAFVDPGVGPATTYRYQVAAVKAVSCAWSGVVSNVAEATTPAPPAPAGLGASAGGVSRVDLTWTDLTGSETGFAIERCDGPTPCAGAWTQVGMSSPNRTTFSDETACAASTYSYRVQAINHGLSNDHNSAWTARASVAVSGFSAGSVVEVKVTWTASMRSDFRDVRFYDEAAGTELGYWLKSKTDGSTATFWVQAGANNAVRMYWGNAVATDSSDAAAIAFDFKDTFRGQAIDATRWVEIDPDGSIAENNDLLLNDVADGWNKALISKSTFAHSDGRTFYADLDIAADTAGNNHFMAGWEADQTSNASYTSLVHGLYWNNYLLTTYEKGAHTGPNTQAYAASTRYEMLVELKATGAKYFVRGGAYASWTLVKETTTYADTPLRVAFVQYSHQASVHLAAVLPGRLLTGTPGSTETSAGFVFDGTWETLFSNEAEATTPAAIGPAALTATAITESGIRLAWQDVTPGEAGYTVSRCQGADCTDFVQVASLAASTTTWDDSGLAVATPYRYIVAAFGGTTCPWQAAAAAVGASTMTPPAPTNLAGTVANTTQINLSWTDTTGSEAGFTLQRCTGSACTNFADVASLAANTSTYSDTSVCNNATYRYRVRADNPAWGAGSTDWSATATIVLPVASAPTSLSASRISEIKVRLAWVRNTTDETGFVLERCAGTGCTDFVQVGTVGAGILTFDDATVVPSTTYIYRVRATKNATCPWTSGPSGSATITTTISAPSGLSATAASTTQVNLSWTDNTASRTGSDVQRCTGTSCDFSVSSTWAAGTGTTYQDTEACKATTYRYRVRATGFAGPSPTSPWTSAVTRATPTPAAPGSVVAKTPTDTTVVVSWTDQTTDETGFRVETCPGQGCTAWSTAGTAAAGATTFTVTGLAPTSWNTFRVVAFKTATCAWEVASATAQAFTAPAAPSDLAAVALDSHVVLLSWSDRSSDEQAFEVQRLIFNGLFVLRAVLPAGTTTFIDTIGVEAGKTYTYRVRAVRGQDGSNYAPVATVTTPSYQAGDNTCY